MDGIDGEEDVTNGHKKIVGKLARDFPTIIRKTKRFAFFERTAHFFKTKCTFEVSPFFKNFSTGLRQYSTIKTALEHHSNAVRFSLCRFAPAMLLRLSPCRLRRFALSRFCRGRPGATRYSRTSPKHRYTQARTTHRQTSSRS